MKFAMAQINSIVGDLEGNASKINDYLYAAKRDGAEIVAFPELAITGYPPQDLLFEESFVRDNKKTLEGIVDMSPEIVGIVGFVDYDKDGNLYNGAAVFKEKKIFGIAHKTLLPTCDVFDEERYFKSAKKEDIKPISMKIGKKRIKLGIEICEDLWDRKYEVKVTDLLASKGANLIVNISASPFYVGKRFEREKLLKEKAIKNKVPIFYINLVGGQDELVFDGQSQAVDSSGNMIAFAKQFEEDLKIIDIDLQNEVNSSVVSPQYDRTEEMYNALVLGIRDYFCKVGFEKAVIGISGGIDSSLTTCIAVDALGKENVIGVSMPSRFSSDHSIKDAKDLTEKLGILFIKLPVQGIVDSYEQTLNNSLKEIRRQFGIKMDQDDLVADENIQPRVRGNCLMDISNRLKLLRILVLNTGNKTELALGYCTLYGDMAGGISALGDVSKLEVYKLAEFVNKKSSREVIPKNVFRKRPSAELKEDQIDPFDFSIVSPLVDEIIENRRGIKKLIKMGYPREIVEDTYSRIRKAEFKRRQASPCIKITEKAFGIGWKMPIVNNYSGKQNAKG